MKLLLHPFIGRIRMLEEAGWTFSVALARLNLTFLEAEKKHINEKCCIENYGEKM